MWQNGWRDAIWTQLDTTWDVIIIGGGITGAGILRLAAKLGWRALLVEAQDFAFGTSSRSSKLVHGGFRYLYNCQYQVTFESVRQREALLREAQNLITPLNFYLPNYERYHLPSWLLSAGVSLYDLMALKWQHKKISSQEICKIYNGINPNGLTSGFRYRDAQVDDTRLVLRIIREAVAEGATAINYSRVESLLQNSAGNIIGVVLRDDSVADGKTKEIYSKVVINATGPWTDEIRANLNLEKRLRKLRGSHLIFSKNRFPIFKALTIFHPIDGRAMFILPWEGTTLVGTTDVDHIHGECEELYEPFASQAEIEYILEALIFLFPKLKLDRSDILSSFSGLRPIISSGASTPSKESRAHQIWEENGLITIAGGKLTTYHIMACQVIKTILPKIDKKIHLKKNPPLFEAIKVLANNDLDKLTQLYLAGRYGNDALRVIGLAEEMELEHIEGLPNIWAEVRWAAHNEGVIHLDDLLLRRVRLGLLLPEGGRFLLPRLQKIIQPELKWSDNQWQYELNRYQEIWRKYYSPFPGDSSGSYEHRLDKT